MLATLVVFCSSFVHAASFTYTLSYDAANRVTQVITDGTSQPADYTWQHNPQITTRTRTGAEPIEPYTIDVSVTGNGTITAPAANIDCGTTCNGTADQGVQVVLTATGDTGFTFSAWGGDCSTETGNTCNLTMDADKTVSATFATDQDNDGIADSTDNCPAIANPQQDNNDGDSLGDACDPDDDNDAVDDATDNCPYIVNPSQTNTDGDTEGDSCDADDDNDGVLDADDLDSLNPKSCEDLDVDNCDDCSIGQDGFGSLVDFDTANDGEDTDQNGQCDVSDPDDDGDGIDDSTDNCPLVSNPGQEDDNGFEDGDGVGDACETKPKSSLCFPVKTSIGSVVIICL